MKIKQFAGGGIVYLPTTNRVAEEAVQETASSDKTSKNKAVDKLLDMVSGKGLDSDVAKFTNAVQMKLDAGLDPNGENLTVRDILQLGQMASSVTTNYARYETAVKNVTDQNAESDLAIDDRGRIYCFNNETKKIKAVSFSEIKENESDYVPLTYEELLNYRRSSSDYAFDTKILDDVNNATGIDTITNYLHDVISKFKTSTIEGYSVKQQNQIQTGLQSLVSGDIQENIASMVAVGPDGVYKIKQTATIVDHGIPQALNYLISTLPNKMKRKLEVAAQVEGFDTQSYLLEMLVGNTEHSKSADWQGQLDDEGKLSKTSKKDSPTSEQYKDDSVAARFARGDLQQTRAFIAPSAEMAGDTAMMALDAWNGYRPMTDDQKPIQDSNVYDIFGNIAQLKGCDQSSISLGNQRISYNDLHGMILDPEKNVTRMALPYRIDSDGAMVPDFDLLIKYNEVNRFVQMHPGTTKEEIRQKLGQFASQVEIKDDNTIEINPSRIAIFGCLGVIASDELIDIDKDRNKGFLSHLDSSIGKGLKDTFNKYVQFGKADVSKNEAKTPKYKLDKSGDNDFYRGWIYMPITDATQAFGMTQQQLVPREDLMDVTKKDIISREVQNNARTNPMITRMQ